MKSKTRRIVSLASQGLFALTYVIILLSYLYMYYSPFVSLELWLYNSIVILNALLYAILPIYIVSQAIVIFVKDVKEKRIRRSKVDPIQQETTIKEE